MNDMRAQREFFYHKSAGKEYHSDTRKPAFFYTGTGDVGGGRKGATGPEHLLRLAQGIHGKRRTAMLYR